MKEMLLFLYMSLLTVVNSFAQQLNCSYYVNDSTMYRACQIYMDKCYTTAPKIYFQGSRASQLAMDSIIEICPYFSHAYYTKSIPYLKRGDFVHWKPLIDKAVMYDSISYLGYRAGARFMFLRDYEGALLDITRFERLQNSDIGYTYNGDYHLKEIKALCYKAMGDQRKAIETLDSYLTTHSYSLFGHYHLGILYLNNKETEKAILSFKKQLEIFDFAGAYYYLARTYKLLGNRDLSGKCFSIALQEYKNNNTMSRDFVYYPDKIYLHDINIEVSDD
ncbi:tetratricopeptide repeat protein [Prolixibacteraceae bacterium]|nr:tetratricopeptide repeat protein [Prolixibacteraceae bacterium]